MNNTVIYTKNKCQACMITKLHLANMGIPYTEKNVDTNEKFMTEAKATGYSSMPIVVKDGVVIASRFQPDRLNQLEEQL